MQAAEALAKEAADSPKAEEEAAAAAEAAKRTYVIKSGDSLSVIAMNELGGASRWPEIYELNKELIGDNPNMIQVGHELVLPSE